MSTHVDASEFYLVSEAFTPGALRVRALRSLDEFAVLRGDSVPEVDLPTFERGDGREPLDLVGTSYSTLWLVSDHLVRTLRENGITGWSTYPLTILDSGGPPLVGYRGFVVSGRCGPIDESRSREVSRPSPVAGQPPYKAWIGLYFAPESWDGSDLFLPSGTGYVLATLKAKRALEGARVRNVGFEALPSVERLMR